MKGKKMKKKQIMVLTVLVLVVCGLAILGGCKKEEPAAPEGDVVTYANTKCPIMLANVINPEKVTDKLATDFKGEKVAFCCAACPDKWDALSDEEKATKLAASK